MFPGKYFIKHQLDDEIRGDIIKALEKEIRTLKTKRNHYRNNIKNKTTRENYKLIKKVVAEKVVILESKIKPRQVWLIRRDKIKPAGSGWIRLKKKQQQKV